MTSQEQIEKYRALIEKEKQAWKERDEEIKRQYDQQLGLHAGKIAMLEELIQQIEEEESSKVEVVK